MGLFEDIDIDSFEPVAEKFGEMMADAIVSGDHIVTGNMLEGVDVQADDNCHLSMYTEDYYQYVDDKYGFQLSEQVVYSDDFNDFVIDFFADAMEEPFRELLQEDIDNSN